MLEGEAQQLAGYVMGSVLWDFFQWPQFVLWWHFQCWIIFSICV